MQFVRATLEQLGMDCGGPVVAALAWMSASGLGGFVALVPLIAIVLWQRGRGTVGRGQREGSR
jgi:hypothetical protein